MRKLLISCRFCSIRRRGRIGEGALPRTFFFFSSFFFFSFLFFALSFWNTGHGAATRPDWRLRVTLILRQHNLPPSLHTCPPTSQPHPPFEFESRWGCPQRAVGTEEEARKNEKG